MSDEQKNALGHISGAADKVVGDIVLGGIGQGAFLIHEIPGVKSAMNYVGENVADGWNAAEKRSQKGAALRLIQSLVTRTDTPSEQEIHKACVEAGISEANLAHVKQQALQAVQAKAQAMANVKAPQAQETMPAAPEVPLPQVTGVLAPAVG